jgi:hypothetical protein
MRNYSAFKGCPVRIAHDTQARSFIIKRTVEPLLKGTGEREVQAVAVAPGAIIRVVKPRRITPCIADRCKDSARAVQDEQEPKESPSQNYHRLI